MPLNKRLIFPLGGGGGGGAIDISTATLAYTTSGVSLGRAPRTFDISNNGTILTSTDELNRITTFDLPTPWDLNGRTSRGYMANFGQHAFNNHCEHNSRATGYLFATSNPIQNYSKPCSGTLYTASGTSGGSLLWSNLGNQWVEQACFSNAGTNFYPISVYYLAQFSCGAYSPNTSLTYIRRVSRAELGFGSGSMRGIYISEDGLNMFISGSVNSVNSNYHLRQYSLSTPYDISTYTFVSQLNVTETGAAIFDIKFSPDLSTAFILGGNNSYYVYNT